MSARVWLAGVVTDEGVEVQSVHTSREGARLACPSHGEVLPLDDEARRALASFGIVVDADGGRSR